MKFTLQELYTGYSMSEVPPPVMENLKKLRAALNALGQYYEPPVACNKGFRDESYNTKVGGQATSPHLTGQAADLRDNAGGLKFWCAMNQDKLKECGLWMEDPGATPTWCHLQIRPASRLVFLPYAYTEAQEKQSRLWWVNRGLGRPFGQ